MILLKKIIKSQIFHIFGQKKNDVVTSSSYGFIYKFQILYSVHVIMFVIKGGVLTEN